jgi:hypothetical protein
VIGCDKRPRLLLSNGSIDYSRYVQSGIIPRGFCRVGASRALPARALNGSGL